MHVELQELSLSLLKKKNKNRKLIQTNKNKKKMKGNMEEFIKELDLSEWVRVR